MISDVDIFDIFHYHKAGSSSAKGCHNSGQHPELATSFVS